MKTCPNCGKANAPAAKFCGGCGTSLENVQNVESAAPVGTVHPQRASSVPMAQNGKSKSRLLVQIALGILATAGAVGVIVFAMDSEGKAESEAIHNAWIGKSIVSSILSANFEREACGKSDLWPVKGSWRSSTDYFKSLNESDALDGISEDWLFEVKWFCLAGIAGEDGYMPFLWSSNLELNNEDLVVSVDSDQISNWSGKVHGTDPVVIVRQNGDVEVVKPKDLSDKVFFGETAPIHPEKLEILNP